MTRRDREFFDSINKYLSPQFFDELHRIVERLSSLHLDSPFSAIIRGILDLIYLLLQNKDAWIGLFPVNRKTRKHKPLPEMMPKGKIGWWYASTQDELIYKTTPLGNPDLKIEKGFEYRPFENSDIEDGLTDIAEYLLQMDKNPIGFKWNFMIHSESKDKSHQKKINPAEYFYFRRKGSGRKESNKS